MRLCLLSRGEKQTCEGYKGGVASRWHRDRHQASRSCMDFLAWLRHGDVLSKGSSSSPVIERHDSCMVQRCAPQHCIIPGRKEKQSADLTITLPLCVMPAHPRYSRPVLWEPVAMISNRMSEIRSSEEVISVGTSHNMSSQKSLSTGSNRISTKPHDTVLVVRIWASIG
jgi:hypothetical protein